MKKCTLEVSFTNDLLNQIIDETQAIFTIWVAFDDFRYQKPTFDSLVDHVYKEVEVFEQQLLAEWIILREFQKEIDDFLEEISIVEHFVLKLLEQPI